MYLKSNINKSFKPPKKSAKFKFFIYSSFLIFKKIYWYNLKDTKYEGKMISNILVNEV